MPRITLYLNDAEIRSEVSGILTSGMVGVEVDLVCDEAWEGLNKTLVCRSGDVVKTVLVQNDCAVVAHEALAAGKWLELGVEGRNDDGSVVIPTLWERCCIVMPGADGDADLTADPTLPVWAQLQSRVAALEVPPVPSDIGALPGPVWAKVGQHFQVAAVNKIGRVVAVEAVDMPSGGESYELPAATAETLGGVKAEPATEADTQPVRIGADGMLFTTPGGGGEKWETIIDYTVPEDCVSVVLKNDINGNPFSLKKAVLTVIFHPLADLSQAGALAFTTDSRYADYPYGCNTFKHYALSTPTEEGKVSYLRVELVKTSTGVWNRGIYLGGDVGITVHGVFTGGRAGSVHEDINVETLQSYTQDIAALGIGSYMTAIGAGTRIVMTGVRE